MYPVFDRETGSIVNLYLSEQPLDYGPYYIKGYYAGRCDAKPTFYTALGTYTRVDWFASGYVDGDYYDYLDNPLDNPKHFHEVASRTGSLSRTLGIWSDGRMGVIEYLLTSGLLTVTVGLSAEGIIVNGFKVLSIDSVSDSGVSTHEDEDGKQSLSPIIEWQDEFIPSEVSTISGAFINKVTTDEDGRVTYVVKAYKGSLQLTEGITLSGNMITSITGFHSTQKIDGNKFYMIKSFSEVYGSGRNRISFDVVEVDHNPSQ
jgi:hypothetical protein